MSAIDQAIVDNLDLLLTTDKPVSLPGYPDVTGEHHVVHGRTLISVSFGDEGLLQWAVARGMPSAAEAEAYAANLRGR